MPQLGPLEILVIFVVALLVFGPTKLPEIGRQVGRGVNEFRKFQHSLRQDLDGMLGGHDDQSDAAAAAPTLPPKDVTPTVTRDVGQDIEVDAAAEQPETAADPGDPMLPLPWPDTAPPPPPPPDDSAPADRTP
jgi:TatA/E family protein of Tat protein translocase